MGSKHKIYLGEDCKVPLRIGPEITESYRTVLYPISGAELKPCPNSAYDEVVVCAWNGALTKLTGQETGFGISISLLVNWPQPRVESPGISVLVNLDDKLRRGMAYFKPKLHIIGVVCSGSESAEVEMFQISDIKMSVSTQSFENFTGASKMQQIVTASSTQRKGTSLNVLYSVILEWVSKRVKGKQSKVLDRLFNDRLLADCSIIPSNLNAVACHRSVLSASSDVFHAMLTSGMEESETRQISMQHVSEEGVNALLAFIYEQDLELESLKTETAIELLKTAHEYNIQTLEKEVVELLHKKGKCFELCAALDLYWFTVNVEGCDRLCEKMLQIFKRNPTKLRSSPAFQELDLSDHLKATDLLFKVLELKTKD